MMKFDRYFLIKLMVLIEWKGFPQPEEKTVKEGEETSTTAGGSK